MKTKLKPRLVFEAVITRKDGSKEDLGVISETRDLNIIKRFIRKVRGNG